MKHKLAFLKLFRLLAGRSGHRNAWRTTCLTLLLSISFSAYSQITVNFKDQPLRSALKQIEQVSDYKFFYNESLPDLDRKMSLNVLDATIDQIMRQLLAKTALSYKQEQGNVIALIQKPSQNASPIKKITGTVVDEQGEPIIGATVMVKGTENGGITDADGGYSLMNVPEDAVISISYIGYKPMNLKASDKSLAKVILKEDSEMLEEVVVVGYGTQKRANLTGAVATISSEDVNNRPVSSAAGALQGADPSVNLTFSTGSLDSDYSIDIRGVASINGGTPLVLCDGMEVSLSQINPADIESISILKDASASAIYGAKASSGVILITTKSGKDSGGKVNISYNGRFAWRQNTTSTDFITTGYDHVSIVNQFYEINQGKKMWGYSDEEMQMLYDRRNDTTENPDRPWAIRDDNGKLRFYANFDWYNYFYRKTRPETEHNVSITGGNEKVNYFASGRYLSQDGIFNIYKDNYKNYSFRAKLDAKLYPFLKYAANVNFNATNYQYAGYYNEQQTIHSLQSNVNSAVMPYTPEGAIVQYVNTMTGANSPLGAGHAGFLTANEARNSRGNKDFIITNQFDFDITKDLVLTASYAYRYRNRQVKRRSMPFDYEDKNGVTKTFTSGSISDYYQELHNNINRHSLNIYATYSHTWNNAHNFTAVAGVQYEDHRNTELSVKQNDLLSKDLSSFSVATGASTITQSIAAYRTLGYFARINYDYEGKYLLEASGRFDGTSRFASKDRWGFFPSASLGWRVSQEEFWEPLRDFWNNGKVRFSIGSLGNQQVATYAYFDQISTDNIMSYTFDGLNKANYASVSDPISTALTWETITTYNWGLDLGFLNNRLTATADVFIRDTKDMLTQSLTLPSVFGANTPKENCADLRTTGWELYVGWNDGFQLKGRRFEYGISASIGDYKSKITKYNNPDKLIASKYEGMTLGEIWGYKVAGLFATDEDAAAYQAKINDKAVNQRVYNCKQDARLRAGDVEFIDLDGDNVISEGSGTVDAPGDKRIIGNDLPRYSYSFRLNASYAGFDLSAFFQGVGKQDWYPTTYAYDFWGPYSFPSLSFIHKDFMNNVWSEENTGAYFPRPRGYASYSGGALGVKNDRYLQNAAYLRFKNLTLGYTVPLKNKKIFNSVRIYVTGENLFYWSPMKKYCKTVDPELTNTSSTYNAGSGVGYGYSRTFSVGLDVKF